MIEKLEIFADLATACGRYWDASANMEAAQSYLDEELTFLSNRDKEELVEIWKRVCEDGRQTKILFNAIKVLSDKYQKQLDG